MYITVDTTQKPNQKTKLADLKTYVPYKSFKTSNTPQKSTVVKV